MVLLNLSEKWNIVYLQENSQTSPSRRLIFALYIEDISDSDDDNDNVEFAHVPSSPTSTSLVDSSSDIDAEWAEILKYTNQLEEEEEKEEENETWVFKEILSHRKNIRGNWEVHVLWESEDITWEPLRLIAVDDPVSCAIYGRNYGLLEENMNGTCFVL